MFDCILGNTATNRMMSVKSSSTAIIRKGLELLNHLGEIVEIGGKLIIKTDLAEIISQTVSALENLIKNSNNAQAGTVLRDVKEKLTNISCLIVHPPTNPVILNRFSVDIYESLQELYLQQCPPSMITNFPALQVSLVNLVISNSGITDLGDIFVPAAAASLRKKLPPYIKPHQNHQISSKYCWNRLVYLSLANCGLTIMDESFHFFPSLVELDISHNDLRSITHLQDCIALEYINASHNRIYSLHHLERTIGHVKRLNFAHNDITSLEGLDKIYSLEEINIMHNAVQDFQQVQYLARLPNLESILLANNPITERRHYRLKVYREFVRVGSMMTGNRDFPDLDKAPISKSELHKLR
jgi:Leucine-rich repeat (LRR) protein